MTTRNRIKCLECGDVLESKHIHDYIECGCENHAFTDGGPVYRRWGAMRPSKVVFLDDNDKECKPPLR